MYPQKTYYYPLPPYKDSSTQYILKRYSAGTPLHYFEEYVPLSLVFTTFLSQRYYVVFPTKDTLDTSTCPIRKYNEATKDINTLNVSGLITGRKTFLRYQSTPLFNLNGRIPFWSHKT